LPMPAVFVPLRGAGAVVFWYTTASAKGAVSEGGRSHARVT
jgi:hypothetical protein